MHKNIFKKSKGVPRKFIALLVVLGGITVITLVIVATIIWWHRPIVIVRISEFSLSTEVEELNLKEQIKNPDLSLSAPKIHGSLNIKIQNIGRRLAENISLNFLPERCKLGKLRIWKTDADCTVKITPSKDPRSNPSLGSTEIAPRGASYFINIEELKPGSEIELKYTIYREGKLEPIFKFGKISSSNAKVKAFYYRR
jgi:hypothetical protein